MFRLLDFHCLLHTFRAWFDQTHHLNTNQNNRLQRVEVPESNLKFKDLNQHKHSTRCQAQIIHATSMHMTSHFPMSYQLKVPVLGLISLRFFAKSSQRFSSSTPKYQTAD
ncbi:hypothetical protein C5167_015573 [Papaver somniferum]|uniref:Uncharacterized protein n=1 Tax=Papaver somniferum TaxID=3469 RepID=A0A4Y7J9I8_PAPSO|nr:hypothetical protein C5167_015573 [Papaver somniferum]